MTSWFDVPSYGTRRDLQRGDAETLRSWRAHGYRLTADQSNYLDDMDRWDEMHETWRREREKRSESCDT